MEFIAHPHVLPTLLAAGIPAPTAREWALRLLPLTADQVVAEAALWHRSAHSDARDVDWCLDGWSPSEADEAKLNGFTFEQAVFVDTELRKARDACWDDGEAASAAVDSWEWWRKSGIRPDLVVLCVAAGRYRVEEGRKLVAELAQDRSLAGTIKLTSACRDVDLSGLV